MNFVLCQAELFQRSPSSDPHLRLHKVNVSDFFSDRVLHLDTRVHFNERVLTLTRAFGLKEELHSSCVLVSQGAGKLQGVFVKCLRDLRFEVWSGRNFDDLLVATLDRAVTFKQVNSV